jgi:cytochrome c
MKTPLTFLVVPILLSACGGGQSQIDKIKAETLQDAPATLADAEKNWKTTHGVGPVAAFDLPADVDAVLAERGREVYEANCTACHKIDKRFIGPAPKDILERRSPAWVMNMILNPEEMVQKDPIARMLLIEYNGSPMANQNLTQEDARAILEYFRTL